MSGSDDEVYVDKINDREWGMAWKRYAAANGKLENIPTSGHLRKFLSKLNINLTEKSCGTLMVICKQKGGNMTFVHLTTLKNTIKEALDKYKGLPVDQAIGGLIVEFNASDTGRKHRNHQSMQSMQAIVAASTQSLSKYALSKVKETAQEKMQRKAREKLQRKLKREKAYAKQHGLDYPKKKQSKLTQENLRQSNKEATAINNRYNHYLQESQSEEHGVSDSHDDDSTHSMVINDNDAPSSPKEEVGAIEMSKNFELSLNSSSTNNNGGGFGRMRSPSSDVALQRRNSKKFIKQSPKISEDKPYGVDHENEQKYQQKSNEHTESILDIGNDGNTAAAPLQIVEILKNQQNMLYRIETQLSSLDRQIKKIQIENEGDEDTKSELRECLMELQYLKTSSLAQLENELNGLKNELFDGFESIAISSAYNVSQSIRNDLHSMNNTINRTVRLWGNDWNIKKRVISNQGKLDHCLFKAAKVLRKYEEFQSNLKSIKYAKNSEISMNVPQFMAEMDSIRNSLRSMDHYLNTFVFDRLSRMENALVRIFQQSNNLSSEFNESSKQIKRFSVDELMNQLDSQRLNFEGQLRKKSEKINQQKEQLSNIKSEFEKERELMSKIREETNDLKGKYEREQAKNKQLQFDVKSLKSQFQRLSMFGNENENGNETESGSDDQKSSGFHGDISEGGNVNLSMEFDKFYSNSLSSLIGDFISRSKLDNKEKANEYHQSKERGHLKFAKDEVPSFLAGKRNDAQQQELEDRLGFGYQELYYLYRENTEINVRCNRLEHENAALRERLKAIEPVIVVENVQNVSVQVQNRLTNIYTKLKKAEKEYDDIIDREKLVESQQKYIDKYRIEMLRDAKKLEQEIQSQMNYDKFQFQRQRKKMNALMKSEKEGVLKEREIMEQEKEEIEELKNEWKEKLKDLEDKELEFDEKVVLAKTNMNEVVFQKGLNEFIKNHKDELKFELREEVEEEALKEKIDEVKEECDAELSKQREFYNQRYAIANAKSDNLSKEKESLKLQMIHLKQQGDKIQSDNDLRYEKWEELSGRYEKLMQQYLILKKEYKELEQSKMSGSGSSNDDGSGSKYKKKKKRKKRQNNMPLEWIEEESDDDQVTKAEKKAIKKWFAKRHGNKDAMNSEINHWLILPEDKLLAKDQDIEDLNDTLKTLKSEMDIKNKQIGQYKAEIAKMRKEKSSNNAIKTDNGTSATTQSKHSYPERFDDDIVTVKKWLRVWEDGIKTVTKAQDKWTQKHSELIKKEKEIQKEKEDLIYDQRMWYAHKNHILRRFFYFTKQVWWQRFMVHEFQKSRADQEMAFCLNSTNKMPADQRPKSHLDCPLWNQYFKMMLEAWFEAGVFEHALTRWFCQYNTYSKEKDLFYYSSNDNDEELYVFKDDIMSKIQPHLDSIVERYYKKKWMKRRMKFGRCFITAEKPKISVDKSYHKFRKIVRELFKCLHDKEPHFNLQDLNKIIKIAEKEMDEKIQSFNRSQWDAVKMTDGVGVVSLVQQERQRKKRKSMKKKESVSDAKRKKKVRIASNEVGRVSVKGSLKKVDVSGSGVIDVVDVTESKDDEKQMNEQQKKRASMKTPKASSQEKTWSHAMQDFKSVNKRKKKNMTKEDKEKLRKKRQRMNGSQQSSNKNMTKRSSVKNPISNLMQNDLNNSGKNGQHSSRASIKMIKPDIGGSIPVIKGNE